jgi:D,D-heptose 1,7-bisphosphate phosphatase
VRAVILAGGRGTRLAARFGDLPKPLVPVAGRPVLEHQIASLRAGGIRDVTLVVGHLADRIVGHFGDGAGHGVRITYHREERPLGTAGALGLLRGDLDERTVVLYGDVVLDMDFAELLAFHGGHGGAVTVVAHPNDHPYDSDILVLDGEDRVTGLLPKNEPRTTWYANRVNAGVFVLGPRALARLTPGAPADLERDVVVPAVGHGQVHAYRTAEYLKDMGTPDRHAQVEAAARAGLLGARHRGRPQRAVFFDRDGTLNQHTGLLHDIDDLRLIDGAAQAVAAVNHAGWLAVVVTNQPVVARGLCSTAELAAIHAKLETLLGERNAYLDDIYACPHHPDGGYPGEVTELKVACACRKPGTALLQRAAARHHIDLSSSYLVGDGTCDVQAGRAAGTRTVLLDTGEGGRDGRCPGAEPDLRAPDVAAAVATILKGGPRHA